MVIEYGAVQIGNIRQQKRPFTLPLQIVGSHWSREAQIDMVAINWDETAVLFGECKWIHEPIWH